MELSKLLIELIGWLIGCIILCFVLRVCSFLDWTSFFILIEVLSAIDNQGLITKNQVEIENLINRLFGDKE